MAELSSIQKLDVVLFLFNPPSDSRGLHKVHIMDLIKEKNIQTTDRLLNEILYKLVKDEYLRTQPGEALHGLNKVKTDYYLLTLDGEIFQTVTGGYETEYKSFNAKRKLDDYYRKSSDEKAKRLNIYTLVLGIGTIGLVLFEILKFFYELSCQSHLH